MTKWTYAALLAWSGVSAFAGAVIREHIAALPQPRPAVEPGPGFRAEGADVTCLAVLEDGTRVYRAYGPKMVFASIIVVGPDGRATIRQ